MDRKEYDQTLNWSIGSSYSPLSGGKGGTGLIHSDDRASWVVEVLDELCRHLQGIGLTAKVAWDDPRPEAVHYQITQGYYAHIESPLGYVEVEGKSIDAVRLCITMESPWRQGKLDWPSAPANYRVTYSISYLVHGEFVKDLEGDLKAETRPIKAGLFEKRITGFEWKGGRLSVILNADSDLMNRLSKMGLPHVVIMPHREEKHVEIRTSTIVADERTARGMAFPTPEAFDAYDRMAQRIRSIVTYSPK